MLLTKIIIYPFFWSILPYSRNKMYNYLNSNKNLLLQNMATYFILNSLSRGDSIVFWFWIVCKIEKESTIPFDIQWRTILLKLFVFRMLLVLCSQILNCFLYVCVCNFTEKNRVSRKTEFTVFLSILQNIFLFTTFYKAVI